LSSSAPLPEGGVAGATTDLAAHWFAVYTNARHEKHVSTQLGLRQIESFLPLYRAVHRWKNRQTVSVELPLFPCYLFVRIDRRSCRQVLGIPGVITLVSRGREPEPLTDFEIEGLRSALQSQKIEPHPYLVTGQRARIKAGPLAGFEGVLVRKKTNYRVVLSLDLIRQSMAVEVDVQDLEVISSPRRLAGEACRNKRKA
jgi:transcription antitermination factor NusG